MASEEHKAASAATRLRFEKFATMIPVIVVAGLLIILFIALVLPKEIGEMLIARALQIKNAVIELLGTLGGFLGMSWGRGHMDKRVDGDGS